MRDLTKELELICEYVLDLTPIRSPTMPAIERGKTEIECHSPLFLPTDLELVGQMSRTVIEEGDTDKVRINVMSTQT